MVEDIVIRKATLNDIQEILHHRRAMFYEMGKAYRAGLDAMQRSTRRYVSKTIAEGSYHGWLAETRGGRVVAGGGVAISPWPPVPNFPYARRATIFNMYTEPEFRRRGLARKLMVIMIDWCRNKGFSTVFLHASNAGRPLYASLGFKPTNEMRLLLKRSRTKKKSDPVALLRGRSSVAKMSSC
jgi:GNAT superfamily N-acetyltransferase